MFKKIYFPVVLLALFLIPSTASAKSFIPNGPLLSRTQNPIYLQTLGQQPTRAVALPKGHFSNWLDMAYSSIYELGIHGNNQITLDMELARLSFNAYYGLGRDMEAGIEVPFFHWNGGYFDSWIQAVHNAFGFPNGGREFVPNGQFRYQIIKDGTTIYNVKRMALGLSDIALSFKYNFIPEGDVMPAMAWRFRLKLPTGKSSSGLGSGNIDYSIGYVAEKSISRWHFYLNLDYIVAPGNDAFEELYNHEMLAWLTTVEFSVSQPVSIIAQLQGSTPLLCGLGTNKWDGFPMDLVLGVKGAHEKLFWGNEFFWQASFSEDVASEGPSVDITAMIVLGIKFGPM